MRPPHRPRPEGMADRLRAQARQCARFGSPLMAELLTGAADDYDAGGPARALLEPLWTDPVGSVPALRFAGALHRLVLERKAPQLALLYPSVGGTAAPGRLWAAARRVVIEHADELAAAVRRPVQTNEVGRSAALIGGLLHVADAARRPVRLLELGASAGLNLLVDRFAYDVGAGEVLGEPGSPVRLVRPWQGRFPPHAPLRIAARAGCDPAPLDPARADDRLTLTSYVWPDQVDRFARLRAALAVAAAGPVPVEPLPGSAFLARTLAAGADGLATVVWHSVVRQYLDPAERAAIERLLDEAGAVATAAAPLFHLTLEPVRLPPDNYEFAVDLVSWPGGGRRRLATCQGHGPPVVWAQDG